MFIVLFHVLYLFGKLIYTRYNCRKQTENTETVDAECGRGDTGFSLRDRNFGIEKFAQPPGDNSDDEEDMGSNIKFFPPAYIQRYLAVQAVLENDRYRGKMRKVVDFGCAELGFVVYLKNTPGVEEILCVDVDKELLESYKHKAQPLHVDFLHTRDKPLSIHVIEGSVTHSDKLLEKTDAVICIELIEHLYPDTLTDLPYNIFGCIKPQVAIMTTPNFEFNVLFKKPGFRHYDHKFEWTRDQFRDWADNIVSRFPEYEVSITGICKGPPGSENLGCCSQMATFHRKSIPIDYLFPGVEGLFKIVTTYEYPFHVDNRSDEQKILDDTVYFIRSYSMYSLEFSDEVPLAKLLDPLKKYCVTVASLKELLEQNGWTIADREKGPVVLIPEPSDVESSSEGENWNNLDLSWNDQDTIDDDWDLDPGPPSHYTDEQLAEMACPRENWGEEPSVETIQEESVQEVDSSNAEVARPMTPEENIEMVENTNEDRESLSDVEMEKSIELNDETEFQKLSNSSTYFDLPTPTECSSNCMRSSSPLTFSFKEILNHTTELPTQKLLPTEFESQLPNDCSKNSLSARNLPRETYRKTQQKLQPSPKRLMDELGSLCSIYLESSRNENSKTCFEDFSDHSFENTISLTSSLNNSKEDEILSDGISISSKKLRLDDCLSGFSSSTLNLSFQCSSSSETPEELKRKLKKKENFRKPEEILNEVKIDGFNTSNSVNGENFVQDSSQISILSFSDASKSTSSIEKWYPVEDNTMYISTKITLNEGSEAADQLVEDEDVKIIETIHTNESLYIKESCESDSSIDGACSVEKKNSKSHSTKLKDIEKCSNSYPIETIEPIKDGEPILKSEISIDEPENIRDESEAEKMILKSQKSFVFKDSCASKVLDLSEIIEVRAISSEPLDTPPNSWSPEVMDSGYPNSASAHDMTPEYDLPSIAHDRISDSESPSIEEAPRPGFLEFVEVENGDLANNNRDYEGNNMIAAEDNEDDDLQPLIDVLEDDMENENDIYVLQNGFPAWLLRILQRQEIDAAGHRPLYAPLDVEAGAVVANAEFDEGFSTSEDEAEEDESIDVEIFRNGRGDGL